MLLRVERTKLILCVAPCGPEGVVADGCLMNVLSPSGGGNHCSLCLCVEMEGPGIKASKQHVWSYRLTFFVINKIE